MLKSHVAIELSRFVGNTALNGGAVAVFENGETHTTFRPACNTVEFLLDFRATTHPCLPSHERFDTSYSSDTCDSLLGSCFDPMWANEDCRGCGCENDHLLRVTQGATEIFQPFPVGDAAPAAGALTRLTACVYATDGPLAAQALDSGFYTSWWGAHSLSASMVESFAARTAPPTAASFLNCRRAWRLM